jgi:hypothetical protein
LTATLEFLDAAFPLDVYPVGVNGIAFYAGGDALNVWTLAEVEACPYQYRLPIWVRSDPASAVAANDVIAFNNQLQEYKCPKGSLVALDSETSTDPAYVQGLYAGLKALGYPLIDYGSLQSVFGNDNPDGYYWGADWTNIPHLASGTVMTQYVTYSSYDESEAVSALPFWNTGQVNGENDMLIIPAASGKTYLLDGGKLHHVEDSADLALYTTANIMELSAPVSATEEAQLLADFPPGNPTVTVSGSALTLTLTGTATPESAT